MLTLRKIANQSCLFQVQGYLFSGKTKLKISSEAQKAVWARKIITTIETSDPPNDIFAPSLRDTLRNLPDPSPQYDFDQEIRKQMLKYFEEGVYLSSCFNSQNRIKRARQYGKVKQKFIFCPNYLVTQPMLKLLRQNNRFLLVSGCFGISKTISLVLYSHLVRPITSFYYNANANKNHQLLLEIKTLESKQLIKQQQKFWYWTINWEQILETGWLSVADSLIDQAHELSQDQIAKLRKTSNLNEFIVALKAQYKKKNIPSLIIIDQINTIASFMRKWNEFIFEKGDLLEKIQTLNEKEQIKLQQILHNEQITNQRPAKKLKQMFDTVKVLGSNGFILNSSINLEKSLIQNPYKHATEFPASHTRFRVYPTLMLPLLGEHEEVVLQQIKYRLDIKKQFGKADFWHFFWFEVERKLLEKKVSKEKLSVAKRIFLLAASKAQVKGFYRNVYIFDNFRKNTLEKQLQKMIEELQTPQAFVESLSSGQQAYFSLEELKKMFPSQTLDQNLEQTAKILKEHPLATYFQQYLQRFDEFAQTCERQRLADFMRKGNYQEKRRFLLVLVSLAERSAEANSSFSYSVEILDYALEKQLTQFFMSEENNQELLPARSDQKGIIHFEWTPEEFIALALPLILPKKGKTAEIFLSKTFRKFNRMNPVYRGVLFQLLFLCQLKPKTRFVFPVYQNTSYPGIYLNWTFEISKNLSFLPINVKVKDVDILQKETYYLTTLEKVTKQSIEAQIDARANAKKAKANTMADDKDNKPQSKEEKFYLIDLDEHLKQILDWCDNNGDNFASAQPIYEGKYFFQSESIDFLFAVKKSGRYEISAFDLTVGSHGIQDKIKGAEDYLKRLVSSKQNSFVFTHYILCPSLKCQKKIEMSKKAPISIQFASVDHFKIENSQLPVQKFILQELQKINVFLRQKLRS